MRLSPPFSSPFRYVELPEATEMVQHYFGGYRGEMLGPAQRGALAAAWRALEVRARTDLSLAVAGSLGDEA